MTHKTVDEMRREIIRAEEQSCPLLKQGYKCSHLDCTIHWYYADDSEIQAKYEELTKTLLRRNKNHPYKRKDDMTFKERQQMKREQYKKLRKSKPLKERIKLRLKDILVSIKITLYTIFLIVFYLGLNILTLVFKYGLPVAIIVIVLKLFNVI